MPTPRRERRCVECRRDISGALGSVRYCEDCRICPKARYKRRHRAKVIAANREYAIRRGRASGLLERGSPESSARISEANRIKAKRGEEHPLWKGDDVGYAALHDWVARNKERTGVCEWCGETPPLTNFANLSGDYRRDIADFAELCPRCHIRYDRGLPLAVGAR